MDYRKVTADAGVARMSTTPVSIPVIRSSNAEAIMAATLSTYPDVRRKLVELFAELPVWQVRWHEEYEDHTTYILD